MLKRALKFFLLFIPLFFTASMSGEAKGKVSPSVLLEGNADGIVYLPEGKPFLEFEGMVPGDSVEGKMILKNSFLDAYEIFLRADGVDDEYLLQRLNMQITYDGKELYQGNAMGSNGLEKNISLGIIDPGKQKELEAKVLLDGRSVGNEYKGKEGKVNWIFTAIRIPQNLSRLDSPKTGDDTRMTFLILLNLLIGCLIIRKVVEKKVRKRQ